MAKKFYRKRSLGDPEATVLRDVLWEIQPDGTGAVVMVDKQGALRRSVNASPASKQQLKDGLLDIDEARTVTLLQLEEIEMRTATRNVDGTIKLNDPELVVEE